MNEASFRNTAQAALCRFDAVMAHIGLSGGKNSGNEYLPLNPRRDDRTPGSLSINRNTGVWSEFATGENGGDLVSLAAYVWNCKQGEAAANLAQFLGLSNAAPAAPAAAPSMPPKARMTADNSAYCEVIPPHAPPPPAAHPRHGQPVRRYAYLTASGETAFYIDRFETAAGKVFAQLSLWKDAGGALKWRWKSPPAPRPLYGLDALAARPHAPVIVCEGEKAAEAARSLFPGFVVICWPGGANAAGKSDFAPLAGRNVTLWPDVDEAGEAAMKEVAAILRKLSRPPLALYRVNPGFFGLKGDKGADAADMQGWDAARCARECTDKSGWRAPVEASAPNRKPARRSESARFRLEDDGVYAIDAEGKTKWICAPLEIMGYTRNSNNCGWGLGVRFRDEDGRTHTDIIHKESLIGDGKEALIILQKNGLRIGAGKHAKACVIEYLEAAHPEGRIRTTRQTGWHKAKDGSPVFVLPDSATYGNMDETWLYENEDEKYANLFSERGTLDDWRENIGKLCCGNSRLLFAASSAFAPPLLDISGSESGGFHFRGNSSCGKTTLLRVACSVVGGKEYMQRWRATDNALESLAMQRCDALLALDELAQIDGRRAGEVAYMLANGSAKARAMRTGEVRAHATWRILYLSAGEISLAQHAMASGKVVRAGQEVRLVDIPAEADKENGVFEDLHGYPGGGAFSDSLNQSAGKWHGTAFRAFLKRLARENKENIAQRIHGERREFRTRFLTEAASGQACRVADRFALVASAGELATEWGITGWKEGEATAAAGKCFKAWLDARGGEGDQEETAMLRQVLRFIEENISRFDVWHRANDDHAPRTIRRAGFVRWLYPNGIPIERYSDKGEDFGAAEYMTELFIFPEVWRNEVCNGYDSAAVARLMAARGFLVHDNDRLEHSVRLPGIGLKRIYHIKPEFLADGEKTTDSSPET
ncbi:MAG: DUF927 domain-containing protein [Azoarcus sp.]|nr:DUF927 domain-containing protein [Azoarcus sp.]